MRLEEACTQFLLSGRAGGWSPATETQYRWHLQRWRAWLAQRQVVDVGQVTAAILREYGASLAGLYALATRRVAAISLRSFLRWCQEEEILPDGEKLAKAIKTPKVPRQAQRTVSSAEVERLFGACDDPVRDGLSQRAAQAAALRNAAMISLLFDSLLRAHELVGLTVADLDLERERVKVRGKGGKVAFVRYGHDTAARLRAWLEVREGVAACGRLFVAIGGNTPGKELTTNGLRSILKRIGARAGVEGLTTHAFRRGGAVAQLEAGAPSRLVQLHGRWDDIRMIEVYTQQLEADSLFDRYSPIEQLGRNGHKLGT